MRKFRVKDAILLRDQVIRISSFVTSKQVLVDSCELCFATFLLVRLTNIFGRMPTVFVAGNVVTRETVQKVYH